MTAVVVVVAFFVFLSCLQNSNAQQSVITLNPSSGSLTLGSDAATGGLVEVTCQFVSSADALLNLNIKRVLHANQAEQDLAGARLGAGQASDFSGDNVAGSSASGTVAERSITFSMPQATCNDDGMYICDAVYSAGGGDATTATSNKSLQVTIDPGQITMTADPQLPVYPYNSSLLLRCSGPVGTVNSDTQIEWIWEYKEPQGSLWTRVTTTGDNFNQESSTPSGLGNCAQNQVVTLQRYVVTEDTVRTYRCHVRRVGSAQDFSQYAGEYTIGTVLSRSGGMPLNVDTSITVMEVVLAAFVLTTSVS